MLRILCLWLPNWPIQRLVQSRPELKNQAVVLTTSDPRGNCVAACCSAAAAQGIRPDMSQAEATSLVRALAIERYEPRQDCRALLKLAEACERFSPCVALEEGDEPESLLLDISNLAHLLGSDAELAARVETFFNGRRYRTQIAVADTIGLAWAVAHFIPVFQPPLKSPVVVPSDEGGRGKGEGGVRAGSSPTPVGLSTLDSRLSTITQLPIDALRITDDTAALLHQLGIETIGQLLPLPRASLASRFGSQLLRRLDQLTGAALEVVVPHRSPAALEVGGALEHPTADRAALMHVLAQHVEQLAGHLAARDQGAVLLVCVLQCADGQSVSLQIGLVEPSASAPQLMELVGLHLETLVLADEVVHVEIRAAVIGRLGERQGELFADQWPSDPHQLAVLVNRLSSRLGAGQVVRPELRPSPLPERTFRYLPATGEPASAGGQRRARTSLPPVAPRPLLLYPEPRPVEVVCVAPDGPPQFVWFDNRRQRITQCCGPERIETLWWAGASVRRDYYRVATESGSGLWIFRRLTDGRWFLHGLFA